MITLTQENYFTPENTAISNSKVSDYLRSKEYYYKRHISHELSFTPTAPVKIGRIVDAIVSQQKVPYEVKVLKRDDPDRFEYQKTMPDDAFVTESQWEEGQQRAQAITREPFYQEYLQKGAKFQVLLQHQMTIDDGQEMNICGMADLMMLDGDTLYIDDCKSVSPMKVKTPGHWYWNCRDMGYFRQMGAYAFMARETLQKEMGFTRIVARHFVVTKEMDGLYKVHLFIIPDAQLWFSAGEFIGHATKIHHEKDWIDPPVTWDAATALMPPNSDDSKYDDEEEGFE